MCCTPYLAYGTAHLLPSYSPCSWPYLVCMWVACGSSSGTGLIYDTHDHASTVDCISPVHSAYPALSCPSASLPPLQPYYPYVYAYTSTGSCWLTECWQPSWWAQLHWYLTCAHMGWGRACWWWCECRGWACWGMCVWWLLCWVIGWWWLCCVIVWWYCCVWRCAEHIWWCS